MNPRFTLGSLALAAVLAGCGGGDGSPPSDAAVIDGWVSTLRAGDVEGAADYFAIPSVVENGPTLVHIESHEDAVAFNEALPCGARLIRTTSAGDFTTATFRLTERPGPGACGTGTGELARTAFIIEDGKIVEWRRVATGGGSIQGEST